METDFLIFVYLYFQKIKKEVLIGLSEKEIRELVLFEENEAPKGHLKELKIQNAYIEIVPFCIFCNVDKHRTFAGEGLEIACLKSIILSK